MPSRILKHKPLVEAILEVKWALASAAPNMLIDPHYKLLLGRLYERLSSDYPEHEQLPSAMIPDEMSAHVVQHRFRSAADGWPLVQVGPGVMTVNETDKYTWDDFRSRCIAAVQKLHDAHPRRDDFRIDSLNLRYIDAVDFDFRSQDVYGFLREKMGVLVELPKSLFSNNAIQPLPSHFIWQSTFSCDSPASVITVRFATGKRDDLPVLLWETMINTASPEVPGLPDGFAAWLDAAHTITDDWFFTLIEGELERRFSGD